MSAEPVVTLKKGKDRPVRRRHPWIFSGAIARADAAQLGDTVVVKSAEGEVLGRGAFSPSSQIRVRMFTFDATTLLDEAFLAARVADAVALRRALVLNAHTNCCRVVFAEGDGVPGFIADLYDDTLVVQCQSAGAERHRDVLVRALVDALQVRRVYERSDADVRKLEGLEPRASLLEGAAIDGPIHVVENGVKFLVDVEHGHKTGFYLDQRDARARVRSLAQGRRVLNCFSYTGGFAISALCGGAAHATSIDTSMGALEMAEKNAAENGVGDKHDGIKGDVFDVLRGMFDEGERFDLIVLDPPKFAPSAAHVEKASRGYRDLMNRGLRLLNPGGLVFTFSCSGAIDRPMFKQIAAQASLDALGNTAARVGARIIGELGHPADHPVLTSFSEGEYLKGLVLAV
jgi:23S rRNA (cytosine1962-C5)-methyltransferase